MEKKELVETLKEHFFTKSEIEERFATKDDYRELSKSIKGIAADISDINDKSDELTASSKTLDNILEARPIERIDRVEKHLNLPKYVAAVADED